MSVDVRLHIFEGVTEEELAKFCYHDVGSKHFSLSKDVSVKEWNEIYEKVADTDNMLLEEVSWSDSETLKRIKAIVGEDLPVIDDALIGTIEKAIDSPNPNYFKKLVPWLRARTGKRCFIVVW